MADLHSSLVAGEATINALTISRNSLERRLHRCNEERKRLVRTNVSLVATEAKLRGEMSQYKDLIEEIADLHGELEARKHEV